MQGLWRLERNIYYDQLKFVMPCSNSLSRHITPPSPSNSIFRIRGVGIDSYRILLTSATSSRMSHSRPLMLMLMLKLKYLLMPFSSLIAIQTRFQTSSPFLSSCAFANLRVLVLLGVEGIVLGDFRAPMHRLQLHVPRVGLSVYLALALDIRHLVHGHTSTPQLLLEQLACHKICGRCPDHQSWKQKEERSEEKRRDSFVEWKNT